VAGDHLVLDRFFSYAGSKKIEEEIVIDFHSYKDSYVGYVAISYNPAGEGRGYTLNLFIRPGLWTWGIDKEPDGWGTFGLGPFFQLCWDNGIYED